MYCLASLSSHTSSWIYFFSSRRRHTRYWRDWSSDVCSSDLAWTRCGCSPCGWTAGAAGRRRPGPRDPPSSLTPPGSTAPASDRKRVVQGKSVDLGGRRIIKKKKREKLDGVRSTK